MTSALPSALAAARSSGTIQGCVCCARAGAASSIAQASSPAIAMPARPREGGTRLLDSRFRGNERVEVASCNNDGHFGRKIALNSALHFFCSSAENTAGSTFF